MWSIINPRTITLSIISALFSLQLLANTPDAARYVQATPCWKPIKQVHLLPGRTRLSKIIAGKITLTQKKISSISFSWKGARLKELKADLYAASQNPTKAHGKLEALGKWDATTQRLSFSFLRPEPSDQLLLVIIAQGSDLAKLPSGKFLLSKISTKR